MKFFVFFAGFLVTVSFSQGATVNLSDVLLRKRSVGEVRPLPIGGFGSSQAFYSKSSFRSPGGYGGGVSYPGAYVGGPTLGLGGRPGYASQYPNRGYGQGLSGSSSSSNSASQSVSSGGSGYPGLGGRPGFGGRPGGFGGGLSGSASNSGSQSLSNGGFSGSSSNSGSQSFSSGPGGLSGSSSQSSSSSNSFGGGRFGNGGSSSQSSSSSNSFSGK